MRRLMLLLVALALAGCSRAHFRNSADRETYATLAEHIVSRAHAPGRIELDPPPSSRLHDPTDPNFPPQPPDDPDAARFMHNPGGQHGVRHWGRDGTLNQIENPGWLEALGTGADGKIKIDANKAMELALVNNRAYQSALEDVYLSALTLTLNRFEFDLRWFLRKNLTYTHFGSGSVPGETNTLDASSQLGFNKNFAAGGQLLVDLANSFVWEFTGRSYRVNSNLLLSFSQPLLRNGGRRVRLETLTQAERNVLYAIRDLARFRKQFWADVTTLEGSYLSLLLQLQSLRNQRANVSSQEQNLRLHQELFRIRGAVSVVQVDQAFQGYQQARLAVLQAENGLQNALDEYKVRLGLPPRLPIELDDSPLEQFQLVSPELEKLREEADAFQKARFAEVDALPTLDSLRRSYLRLSELLESSPERIKPIEEELKRAGTRLARKEGEDEARVRAREKHQEFVQEFPGLKKDLVQLAEGVKEARGKLTEVRRQEDWEELVKGARRTLTLLDQAIAIQTQVRVNLIELPIVPWTEEESLWYARENRLDLQNGRARVTDAWRRVSVAANALRSDLNVLATANLATEANNKVPFDFSAQASRYAVGLQFDGPLNRQAERNAFRASQVSYQRSRRDWMLLSDQVEQAVRRDLRGLQLERLRFEIARQSLLSAARQVEAARVRLQDQRDANNTASTLDILNSLNNLLQARNELAGSYISHEQQRIRLLLDLEALQLDDRGFPTDERPPSSDAPQPGSLRHFPPAP